MDDLLTDFASETVDGLIMRADRGASMVSCLIVDDSKTIRNHSRRLCEDEGFDCEEAEDGAIGLAICRRRLPDVMLVDWNMPVMDGISFITALRALPGGDKPLIILCTTENDIAHIEKALKAGANECIMKPFDAAILHSKFEMLGVVFQDAG